MTSAPSPQVWQIVLNVPSQFAGAFEEAIEPFCDAVSCFVDEVEDTPREVFRIEGICEGAPDGGAINTAVAMLAEILQIDAPMVDVSPMRDRDWLAENLQSFAPFDVGQFYIYGSHVTDPPPFGRIPLCIDPGRAFGTGTHASTAGCLRALQRLHRAYRPRRCLDMGCGSAILALAMAAQWRVPVLATDIDALAVQVARKNVDVNGYARWVTPTVGRGYQSRIVGARGPYDVIVANILARPLAAMAGDLARHLAPRGLVVLSGFLVRDERRVLNAHRRYGLKLSARITVDGWRTLVLQR